MPNTTMQLTSSEISSLWTAYMNNSMSKQILKHMIQYVKDPDIKPVMRFALNLANVQERKFESIYHKEDIVQSVGFTEKDVNLSAPPLFTDTFSLSYINHMAKVGMIAYGGYISMSYRQDLIDFFSFGLEKTNKLFKWSNDILRKKGLLTRAPFISLPKKQEYISKRSYLSGYSLFHKKRPLNSLEISHLFMNAQTNNIGYKICLAFGQTTRNNEVEKYMIRGRDISKKHLKLFMEKLLEDDIQCPLSADIGITTSMTKTFSDKLMMFHMSLLSAAGMGNYATAAAASQRSDLTIGYERLSLETGQYAMAGGKLMMKYQWMEEPPGTIDKELLIKKKIRKES